MASGKDRGRGGMQDFVGSRNPPAKEYNPPPHASYDGFRMPLKSEKPNSVNSRSVRSKGQQRARQELPGSISEPRLGHDWSRASPALHDAAVNVSDMSLSSTLEPYNAAGLMDSQQHQQQPYQPIPSEQANGVEVRSRNEGDQQRRLQQNRALEQYFLDAAQQVAGADDGFSMKQVKGDSYPPTTSGRSSAADSVPYDDVHRQMTARPLWDTREEVPRPAKPTKDKEDMSPPNDEGRSASYLRIVGGKLSRDPITDQTSPGFTFGLANDLKSSSAAPQPQGKSIPSQNHETSGYSPRHPAALNPPQQRASRGAASALGADELEPQKMQLRTRGHGSVPTTEAVGNSKRRSPSPPVQVSLTGRTCNKGRLSDYHRVEQQRPQQRQSDEHEQDRYDDDDDPFKDLLPLDYPEDHLIHMSYQDVKEAPFDQSPNANPFQFAGRTQPESLDEKLDLAAQLAAPEDQAEFFLTLRIEEWEDAGDWFVGRFSDIFSRLKATRRAKRTAARAFEDEIEKRYVAVSNKRKSTDEALSEMKKNGGRILERTPKKVTESQ